jgi:hypothetical protein
MEYTLAAVLGGGLATAMFQAFLLGIIGAAGGLFFKWVISSIQKHIKKG